MVAKEPLSGLRSFAVATLLSTTLIQSTTAILVSPGSPCAYMCGNVLSSTSTTDFTCSGSTLSSSQTGQTWEACLNCELNSTYVDSASKDTDLNALLYNMRYATSACLWGTPGNVGIGDNQCVTAFACGKLLESIQYQNLSTEADTFGYCDSWHTDQIAKCEACVGQLGDKLFLSNYFAALDAGCSQRPANGSSLSVAGQLFGTTPLIITTPAVGANGTTYNFDPNSGPLTLAAKVGIAVGGIVFLLIVAGCIIVCNGKRRRRAHLRKLERNSYHGPPVMTQFRDNRNNADHSPQDTISSQRRFIPVEPLQTHLAWQKQGQTQVNESPISALGEQKFFSPYVSPVSPQAAREWTIPITLNSAIDDKGKKAAQERNLEEAIEMQQLAASLPMAPMAKGEKKYESVPVPAPYASPPPTKTTFGNFEGQN